MKHALAWLIVVVCSAASLMAADKPKKVVFIAGPKSHGWGAHEHKAGSMLLADRINKSGLPLEAHVVTNGWPKDDSILDDAAAVVIYSDGGGGHPALPYTEKLDKLAARGVGIGCIHYAVEVPKGPDAGDKWLDYIGGYFETHWSVNPHWIAEFDFSKTDPQAGHPVRRGVSGFRMNDEWYYHMRFQPGMKGVTPILSDLPPDSTLRRKDGPHSGNPHVRAAVQERKEKQHVMWVFDRTAVGGKGRGFGFTGGHFHWNWGHDRFRKVVLNAIAWIAHVDVPENGVPSATPTAAELEANQDYPKPDNWNSDKIQQQIDKWNGESAPATSETGTVKPKFASPIVTRDTPGHAVDIEADITGAKHLYLLISDANDGIACDWADWAEPRLIGPGGEVKLTDLKWSEAHSEWGSVRVNSNAGGGPLLIDGKSIPFGLGAHANSLIAYKLPADHDFTTFEARGGLDNGGTDQGGGSSVQFAVFTEKPDRASLIKLGITTSREPDMALDGLEVGDGLAGQLFASEPMMLSPTNIDIDHLGRVWVCEVVNYRGRSGQRPEGDRILILEDTGGDGIADKQTVFYQGRDIDSALGICVLPTPSGKGTRVIVSVAPNVFVFTDDDGDGKADRKDVLFTNVGRPQHDHSTHAFVFGPDGKLYWNFGNTGKHVHDKDGNIVVSKAGHEVRDNGKPYRQGMVFRCNPDGSDFEVLAWNFRNNYEVTVDSFGTAWQSDNDDDGNRGVRINYVMEFGNYGYTDEITGAGWREKRVNLEPEIPLQHWHLNDPGVVPNLLQTGAGSPTGITMYEGTLLPEVFRGQMIHADAGPNIVRAYPVAKAKAGYDAEVVDILKGTSDKWFRPSDVAVAPDGSLIVADWYDPGVGGHAMGDTDRGRLFRVTVPGRESYDVPTFDLTTPSGAIAALKNPNYAVRYMAWTALHEMGEKAQAALLELFNSDASPHHRARALWLLTKIPGKGRTHIETAVKDADPDIRITALRAARQLEGDLMPLLKQLASDRSPQVRREVAIALRHSTSNDMPALWAELAAQHDGQDRWYLEALGIASDLRPDACFGAWLSRVGSNWNTPAGRDIVWRTRAAKALPLLAEIITDPKTSESDRLRYFRAFHFHTAQTKQDVLVGLLEVNHPEADKIATLAIQQLGRVDLSSSPSLREAVKRAVQRTRGTPAFVSLVQQFNLRDETDKLIRLALANPAQTLGVDAARLVLQFGQADHFREVVGGDDPERARAGLTVLGFTGERAAMKLLLELSRERSLGLPLRNAAISAIGKTRQGERWLLDSVKSGGVADELHFAAANVLHGSTNPRVRNEAAKHLNMPAAVNNKPLPPVAELAKRKGDPANGKVVFGRSCTACHQVNQTGIEFGPDLSEIGSKLAKDALYVAILEPSAGISFGYEGWLITTRSGSQAFGYIVSETPDTLTIKQMGGIEVKIPTTDIAKRQKQATSLMTPGLAQTMTEQELVDVVEYLSTLKKK